MVCSGVNPFGTVPQPPPPHLPGVLVISEPYPEGPQKSATEGVTLGYMQNLIKRTLSMHEGGLLVCPA